MTFVEVIFSVWVLVQIIELLFIGTYEENVIPLHYIFIYTFDGNSLTKSLLTQTYLLFVFEWNQTCLIYCSIGLSETKENQKKKKENTRPLIDSFTFTSSFDDDSNSLTKTIAHSGFWNQN